MSRKPQPLSDVCTLSVRLLLVALMLPIAVPVHAAQRYQGRTVAEVLRDFQEAGVKLVFSNLLVVSTLCVKQEPRATTPREVIGEILAPHGLGVREGPGGSLLVVRLEPVPSVRQAPAKSESRGIGAIEGDVIDQDTFRPVIGAVVVLEGTSLTAAAGDDGRFRIEHVPAGVYVVRAEGPGYLPLTSPELQVSANRSVPIALELARSQEIREDVIVTATAVQRPPHVTTSSFEMGREEIRRSAGSMGDVNRLVQALPGLAALGDLRNDLVARGGSPSENLTLVDGIEVPTVNHFPTTGTTGGVVAMLNNELIGDASFLAGGFPAEYGNRLSSVLDIRLREGNRSRPAFEADVNFAGAALIAEGPLGSRGSWIATGRRSVLDLFAQAAGGELSTPIRMNDYTFKANYDTGTRDKVWVVGFGGNDDIQLKGEPDDLESPDLLTFNNDGWRTVTGAAWQHLFGTNAVGVFSASDALMHYHLDVTNDGVLEFVNTSIEGETTVKYDLSWQLANRLTLRAGGSWQRLRRGVVIDQPLGVETPFSVQPREDVAGVTLDVTTAAQIRAGHAQLGITLLPRARLTVGARIDQFAVLDKTTVSPRVGVETTVSPQLTVSLSAGRYHQQPELTSIVARPENAQLAPMQADHVVLGSVFQARPDLRISIEGYRKWYRDYPVSLDFPAMTIANYGIGFDMAQLLFPLTSQGRGRSQGVELFIKKRLSGGMYGQVAYSLSRTEQAALDGVLRRGSFDTPHVLTLLGGFTLGDRWEVSARFTYASGRPFTPPLLPQSLEQNRWIHDLSQFNGQRLPNGHRLDVRVDRRFRWGRRDGALFVEAQNVYNLRGIAAYEWNEKTRQPQGVKQFGLLPVLGVNIKF